MKIFIEVLKKIVDNNNIDYIVKIKTEKPSMAKAQKALYNLVISNNEKKRIHKCFHDEDKNKPCEIVN